MQSNIGKGSGSKWPSSNTVAIRLAKHVDTITAKPAESLSEHQEQDALLKVWDYLELALIDAIYGSNMIEGAGTSRDITTTLCRAVFRDQDVVSADINSEDPTYGEHVRALLDLGRRADENAVIESRSDIINHAKAFSYMAERVILNDEAISEEMIRETHRIFASGMQDHYDLAPGEYRTHEVAVRYKNGRASRTINHKHVPGKMAQMVADLQQDMTTVTTYASPNLAARCHQIFVYIHPFADGNGRLSRILLNVLLLKFAGRVCVIGMRQEDRDAYLVEVKKGCRKYHEQDGEVKYEEQTAHWRFGEFILEHSR